MGRWHGKAVKKAGGCLSAIVDTNPEAARRLAAGYRKARIFDNVEKMLNQVALDVLHICTPAPSHKKIAELGIEAGLNLIIEKPMTPLASDTEYLFNKAADCGLLICPVHQFIFQEGAGKALEWIQRVGRLIHIGATICSAGGTGMAYNMLDTIVVDILPHPLSLMQVFLPDGLSEKEWVTLRTTHGELRAINKNSDISLSIFISMSARPTECSLSIVGTDGKIHIDMFHGFAFIEPGDVSKARKITHPFDVSSRMLKAATANLGQRIIQWEPAYPGLQRLVDLFYRAVRMKTASPISPRDAIAVGRVRDIIIQSTGLAIN